MPFLPPGVIEPHEGPQVGIVRGPSVGATRERGQDPSRARIRVAVTHRLTAEDPAAARRVPRLAGGVRTVDLEVAQSRIVVLTSVDGERELELARLQDAFRLPHLAREVDPDQMRTGSHRDPHLESSSAWCAHASHSGLPKMLPS